MEETRSWSDLPQYLLELILMFLGVPDRLLFGSVCGSWYIAQRQCPLLPFAVFYRAIAKFNVIEIISPLEKRMYKMFAPELDFRWTCISSSHGWMLFANPYDTFVSLLMKNKECVLLPRRSPRVHYLDCLFFSTPSGRDGVIFIRKSDNTFLLYRLCDRKFYEHQWKGTTVSNTIFVAGKLYTLSLEKGKKRKLCGLNDDDWSPNDEDWSLAVVDPLFPGDNHTVKMKLKLGNNARLLPTLGYHVFTLVESCGETLLVRMMWNCVRNLSCEVFRANLTRLEWTKVENLGDRVLFLSHGSSISVSASEMGCKGNHIYYIPSKDERLNAVRKVCKKTAPFVEFKLGSNEMIPHSIPACSSIPVWFNFVVGCTWLTPCLP